MSEIGEALATLSAGLKTLADGINVISKQVNQMVDTKTLVSLKGTTKSNLKKSIIKTDTTKKKQRDKVSNKGVDNGGGQKAKTASDTVYELIRNSNDVVSYADIEECTGYNKKKIANIFFNLKKQRKIKSVSKGVYTIA